MNTERPSTTVGIRTRYHGPTDTKGGRISACNKDGMRETRRIFVPYDHALDTSANHHAAASAWVAKFIQPRFDRTKCSATMRGHSFDHDTYWSWNLQDLPNGERV